MLKTGLKKKVDAQNDTIENREERLGTHTPKTVGGPKVRTASESIVEPYRETVMAMVKSGGNHRTIYPVIQGMGYTGSRNAIYQYILKLRKEVPDQLKRKLTEMPPEMTLESYPRDKIYSAILKKASIGRPGNEENSEQDTKSEAKKKTPKANNSPFSAKVTELILGPEKEISEEKERPKKNQLFHKAIEMYPIILILIQFLKDVYNVFDSRDIGALDMLIHTYSESDVDALAQYVKGLSNDYEAIKNSLVYGEISNGPIVITSRLLFPVKRLDNSFLLKPQGFLIA